MCTLDETIVGPNHGATERWSVHHVPASRGQEILFHVCDDCDRGQPLSQSQQSYSSSHLAQGRNAAVRWNKPACMTKAM